MSRSRISKGQGEVPSTKVKAEATRRRFRLLLVVTTVAAVAQCWFLAAGLPVVSAWEGWFWVIAPIELPCLWAMAIPVLVLVAGAWALVRGAPGDAPSDAAGGETTVDASAPVDRVPGGSCVRLMLVLLAPWLACLVMQYGVAYTAGKGAFNPFRLIMISTGHIGFGYVALQQKDMAHVVSNYEELLEIPVDDGGIPRYPCVVKPPGHLLFYMATQQLAEDDSAVSNDRAWEFLIFAAYLWPGIAALAAVLLLAYGRRVAGEMSGRCGALLFAVVPNVILVIMHLDQVAYPALTVAFCLAVQLALERKSAWLAVFAGAVLYLATFITFSMVAVVMLLGFYSALVPLPSLLASSARGFARWREAYAVPARAWALVGCGFLIVHLVFSGLWEYDVFYRFHVALAEHHTWKSVEWTLAKRLHYAVLDLTEFSLWVGWPLMILWLAGTLRSVARLFRRNPLIGVTDAFTVALLLTLLTLAFFGKTPAETGRLWLFLVPLLCLVAGHHVTTATDRADTRARVWLLTAVCLLQTCCVVFTKAFQDFR